MDPRIHSEIANKLERAKASGLICDYFVSWVGWGGRLDPVVRGWTNSASSQLVRWPLYSMIVSLRAIGWAANTPRPWMADWRTT